MSPEARLDTLNSHFYDWNWRKLCGMGETLHSRLIGAREQVEVHTVRFRELQASLDNQDVVMDRNRRELRTNTWGTISL